ncbi:MAG: ketol-acid reductoisomerase [Gammaproteobacteria bacterium]|nr:MAG: ketol-acid reductoisomerase [Gammaproteobacteria bacterium]
MRTYFDMSIEPASILGRRVAVMGFGAQGRAHALNLRDSGVEVVVGLRRESSSRGACQELGLPVQTPARAASSSDVVVMLVPDQAQPDLYRETLAESMKEGSALVFAHGYSIHFKHIDPRADLDVLMVAPLGIGDQVRALYEAGRGVPALLALHQNASGEARDLGLGYAWANGHGRAGIFETTFRDETETDLFAEQAVLCGGLTHLISAAFDTLVDAGYPEELAYFGCLHEVKLIADLVHQRGIAGMRKSISSTAEFGDYSRGPRIINEESRHAMREILEEVRDGRFDRELSAEAETGFPALREGRSAAQAHPIEAVGERLRAMMPWLSEK